MDEEEHQKKINLLRKLQIQGFNESRLCKEKYKKLKKQDEWIEICNSLLNATSIALIVAGFTFPPCLIASAAISGFHFIVSSVHKSSNLKQKIEKYDLSSKQWSELGRYVASVLNKNNLTSQQYNQFIDEVHTQINLIEDSSI